MDPEEVNENSRDIYNSTRDEILNEIHTYIETFGAGQLAAASAEHYIMKAHDDDVIFSYESLQEFIRLIQRQGIHNLYIYSVTDDLIGGGANINDGIGEGKGGYMNIYTREAGSERREFCWNEIKEKQGFFVIVRYSFAWQDPSSDSQINVKSGRHQFVKAIGTVNLFDKVTSNPAIIVNRTSNLLSVNTHTNGTFSAIIDSQQYDVRLRGFNANGEYTGAFKPASASATNKTFLRGDGEWTNNICNTIFSTTTNTNAQSGVNGPGGTLYFYSNQTDPKNRGIYGKNADGTAVSVMVVNQDNIVTFGANSQFSKATTFNSSVYIVGATTMTGATTITKNLTVGGSGDNAVTVKINGKTLNMDAIPSSNGTTSQFLRGGGNSAPSFTNILTGSYVSSYQSSSWVKSLTDSAFTLSDATSGYGGWICGPTKNGRITISTYPSNNDILYFGYGERGRTTNSFVRQMTWDAATGYLTATRVYKAVFNDYAEYRQTIDLSPGHIVVDNDDGSLSCTTERLQPGAQVISDTFGDAMGWSEQCQTPLAVAGRVLVYTYQPRENYHAGMAVCSAPDGTVDIMTREEIKEYPDCIVGIVSEIPQYEKWGTDQVDVDGRIWIKVK